MSKLSQFFEKLEPKLAEELEWLPSIGDGNSVWDVLLANGLQLFTVGLAGW